MLKNGEWEFKSLQYFRFKTDLKYTDCLHDEKRVSSVLYENNIQILRIRPGKSIYPQVTIHVNDYDELNMLIQKLNDACLYTRVQNRFLEEAVKAVIQK